MVIANLALRVVHAGSGLNTALTGQRTRAPPPPASSSKLNMTRRPIRESAHLVKGQRHTETQPTLPVIYIPIPEALTLTQAHPARGRCGRGGGCFLL